MSASPHYSKTEIERRWLIPSDSEFDRVSGRERRIEDRYVLGTRLRLRKVTEAGHATVYKLGKKYEPEVEGTHQVVSIYLSESEYEALAHLPARVARKRRLSVYGGSLDVYEHPNTGLRVFEVEFATPEQAAAYAPPRGVGDEITNEPRYSGHAVAAGAA